jgi:glutathione reductase (NADPH)
VPNTGALNLDAAGISAANGGLSSSGHIAVDAYQNTVVPGVHAVGDVCGQVELTPMAIAAGRRLADRYTHLTEY